MIHNKILITKDIQLVVVSDLHIGLKGYREDIFDDMLKVIAQPNTYWIGLGDFVEGREPSHKFYDADEVVMTVGEQYAYFFDRIRPFMKKCIGLHPGNHEESLIRTSTINPLKQFCIDNCITYLGACARTLFTNKDKEMLSLITTHGSGGGTKVGSSLNKIVDYAKTFNADMVVIGHYHKLAHTEELKNFIDEEGELHWKPMTVILNGSALEAYMSGDYGGYAEKKLLPPSALGYAVIEITKDLKRQVRLVSY